jgi:hypothetical protein
VKKRVASGEKSHDLTQGFDPAAHRPHCDLKTAPFEPCPQKAEEQHLSPVLVAAVFAAGPLYFARTVLDKEKGKHDAPTSKNEKDEEGGSIAHVRRSCGLSRKKNKNLLQTGSQAIHNAKRWLATGISPSALIPRPPLIPG